MHAMPAFADFYTIVCFGDLAQIEYLYYRAIVVGYFFYNAPLVSHGL